jgi:hypothetical protein
VMEYPDGKIDRGQWKDGGMDGYCESTLPSGEISIGCKKDGNGWQWASAYSIPK